MSRNITIQGLLRKATPECLLGVQKLLVHHINQTKSAWFKDWGSTENCSAACKWPNSQIPECTCYVSHNAPFRTEMCTFLFWMEHCGIWNRCILGFVKMVYFALGITFCVIREKTSHITNFVTLGGKLLKTELFQIQLSSSLISGNTGISLGMHPANERRHYNVTMSLIGWMHT